MFKRQNTLTTLQRELRALGAVDALVEQVVWPLFLLDADGTIRWQNDAAVDVVGDRRRGRFLNVVAPDYRHTVQHALTRMRLGEARVREVELVLLGPNRERRRVHASGATLTDGAALVGVLSVMRVADEDERSPTGPRLAPRQHETLRLLADGRSTDEIAAKLGVTRETARGYIRRLLRTLGAHSRLEAVARGRNRGLV